MKLNGRQKIVNVGQTEAARGNMSARMSVPYAHVAMLVKLGEAYSVDILPLLERSGFSRDQFDMPHARVSDEAYTELLSQVDELIYAPDLWFRYGSWFSFATIGDLGQLLVTCRNGREALPLFCRYYGVVSCGTALEADMASEGNIYLNRDCSPGSRVSIIKTEILASAFCTNAGFLLKADKSVLGYEFDYSKPSNGEIYQHYLGRNISFGHERCRIIFSEDYLDIPFGQANDVMKSLALNNCHGMLERIKMQVSIEARVRNVVLMTPGFNASREDVAVALGLSSRTLTRRLNEEGVRFDEVRRDVQYRRAKELLSATQLTINEIAPLIGFDNGSNFTRAFVKWSGYTPSEFRRRIEV